MTTKYEVFNTDCFQWMEKRRANSLHAVCTDPPYGLIEFSKEEIVKLRSGNGGIWRLPPVLNGCKRAPLPRFTILSERDRIAIQDYFENWGKCLFPSLVPGGHVLVAGNSQLLTHVQQGMLIAGYEIRGTVVRVYQGFRGGDRPKNAELEFPDVCVSLKGCYEPWMLFRKPISEKTVAQNLRKWGSGALRMLEDSKPVPELILSARTPRQERSIAPHPCLKPQHIMRILVRSLLPMGEGIIFDPFLGAGSTVAAAKAVGYQSIGIEIDHEYYEMALSAIPKLAGLYPSFLGEIVEMPSTSVRYEISDDEQMQLILAEERARYGK